MYLTPCDSGEVSPPGEISSRIKSDRPWVIRDESSSYNIFPSSELGAVSKSVNFFGAYILVVSRPDFTDN